MMMMTLNCITTAWSLCGLCFPTTSTDRVRRALSRRNNGYLNPTLCEALLANGDDAQYRNLDDDSDEIPFRGLPKQPLYQELARRMEIWSQCTAEASSSLLLEAPTTPLVPASVLQFSELDRPILPHSSSENALDWLQQAGNDGVLHLLGMRSTIGTVVGRLPPSWTSLVQAANQIHKQSLSVAARARAKHAHRGGASSFFGVAKGSAASQNVQAEQVVLTLLREAIWINIHTFGGMNDQPVLEIRVESGYGARWACEYDSEKQLLPTNVVFRGFLEPQMENGHLVKWRHEN